MPTDIPSPTVAALAERGPFRCSVRATPRFTWSPADPPQFVILSLSKDSVCAPVSASQVSSDSAPRPRTDFDRRSPRTILLMSNNHHPYTTAAPPRPAKLSIPDSRISRICRAPAYGGVGAPPAVVSPQFVILSLSKDLCRFRLLPIPSRLQRSNIHRVLRGGADPLRSFPLL